MAGLTCGSDEVCDGCGGERKMADFVLILVNDDRKTGRRVSGQDQRTHLDVLMKRCL